MTVTYEVNSTAINAGINAIWETIPTGGNTDGTQKIATNWYRHIWQCAEMEMTEWLVLIALRGAALTELKTTLQATPNSTGTYSTAKVLTVVGQHRARQMLNVRVEFMVDVTS